MKRPAEGWPPSSTKPEPMSARLGALIRRSTDIHEGEVAALIWSTAYFFCILCAYYILRPIRDEMGVAGGVDNLAWLFTGTLVGMLLIHPVFTALVTRVPRRQFVPWTYRFFILNLLVFFLLLRFADAAQSVWIGRFFFIWVSIFNLFVVSVFWSFMTDLFQPEQSKRLFGILAVGGTVGAVMGSSITAALVGPLGPVNLLLLSALLLELAGQAARALDGQGSALARAARDDVRLVQPSAAVRMENPGTAPAPGGSGSEVIGGRTLDGVRDVLTSPYLLGIAALMLLFTITSTFLYFQQAAIISDVYGSDRSATTRLFANMDLLVNLLTLASQLFLTGRVLKWFGIGATLAFLPVLTLIGFAILGAAPILLVLVLFQVVRRAGNYALQRPAREVLYTVLSRSDKYKSKNFNDTFVYRVGDQLGAWSYTLMGSFGLGLSALAFTMLPVSALWIVLALWLGRRYADYQQPDAPMALTPQPRERAALP